MKIEGIRNHFKVTMDNGESWILTGSMVQHWTNNRLANEWLFDTWGDAIDYVRKLTGANIVVFQEAVCLS